jgi:hypothetical protein
MSWLIATADELDALARQLGADRFPGVTRSVFDELPAGQHPLLAERFVATLVARGLVLERDGRPVLAPGAAVLLDPVVTAPVRYVVDTETAAGATSVVVAVGRGGHVVRHQVAGRMHRFDLLGTDGDADAALAAAGVPVAPAGAVSRALPGRRVADQLPPAAQWESITVVRRVEQLDEDTTAVSWRVTVDLGGGDVRTVEPSADDDTLDPDADPLFTLRTPSRA